MIPTPWIALRQRNPAARLRLFCLPFAGGGAGAFRGLAAVLPPWVEVCPIQLPGRETRLREPPLHRLDAVVRQLAGALPPWLDLPYVLFGYSMGTLIAFELARLFRAPAQRPPSLLVMGARAAPEVTGGRVLHALADNEFRVELAQLGGTPAEVLENPELLELLLPTLRADFTAAETYRHVPGPPLDAPLVVYGGEEDPEAPPASLEGWRAHTLGPTRVRVFPGGHFFLHTAREQVVEDLRAELTRLVDPSP